MKENDKAMQCDLCSCWEHVRRPDKLDEVQHSKVLLYVCAICRAKVSLFQRLLLRVDHEVEKARLQDECQELRHRLTEPVVQKTANTCGTMTGEWFEQLSHQMNEASSSRSSKEDRPPIAQDELHQRGLQPQQCKDLQFKADKFSGQCGNDDFEVWGKDSKEATADCGWTNDQRARWFSWLLSSQAKVTWQRCVSERVTVHVETKNGQNCITLQQLLRLDPYQTQGVNVHVSLSDDVITNTRQIGLLSPSEELVQERLCGFLDELWDGKETYSVSQYYLNPGFGQTVPSKCQILDKCNRQLAQKCIVKAQHKQKHFYDRSTKETQSVVSKTQTGPTNGSFKATRRGQVIRPPARFNQVTSPRDQSKRRGEVVESGSPYYRSGDHVTDSLEKDS